MSHFFLTALSLAIAERMRSECFLLVSWCCYRVNAEFTFYDRTFPTLEYFNILRIIARSHPVLELITRVFLYFQGSYSFSGIHFKTIPCGNMSEMFMLGFWIA